MIFILHTLPTWILMFSFVSFTFVDQFSPVYATTGCLIQCGFMYCSIHQLLMPHQEKFLPETNPPNM